MKEMLRKHVNLSSFNFYHMACWYIFWKIEDLKTETNIKNIKMYTYLLEIKIHFILFLFNLIRISIV